MLKIVRFSTEMQENLITRKVYHKMLMHHKMTYYQYILTISDIIFPILQAKDEFT